MRLRDWLDPGAADMLIPVIGITMLAAPFVGAAIGYAVGRRSGGSRIRSAAVGFFFGYVVSLICFTINGPLVGEYWAG